jgi:hypothetical protein
VGLQVALEVEDLELIRLSDAEELAERSIRLDQLLLHETLLLGVGANLGGDLGAAEESTLGLAEEDAELIGNLSGLLKDGLLLGLIGGTLRGGLATTAALAGLLELTRDTLLKLLELREEGGNGLAEAINLLNNGVELGDDVDLLGDGGGGRRRLNDGRGGDDDRGNNDGGRSRRSDDRGRGGNCRGSGLLLGGGLAGTGGLGRGGRGAHLMSGTEEFYACFKRMSWTPFKFGRCREKKGQKFSSAFRFFVGSPI